MIHYDIVQAIESIRPGAKFTLRGDDISGLEWSDPTPAPTADEILMALQSLPRPVNPQDLMAQITVDDAAKIQAYIADKPQAWLLWASFNTQKDAMLTSNERFRAGWFTLKDIIGDERMSQIAQALGITVT
ncbi:hypothetical protein [Bradyrhizobium elkanii]|uniref:Uncharacterized protein n=1 Tax=Bradyrhizobium elkanii TaxID=29448 RepID=A0ABV4F087_BRAEL|nr:hypothetical protein [Bradyrhizobium elkanii]MCP1757832.1 hypothetical protein [Bradyrhizobium elkanii]MCS3881871.1 hypothetical protein [Bradyrhizobium elkanii]MCS4218630.1 hypothetical protein [Bradyrhizobium elkanii]MCW2110070.1 hypothetical protein [Bradyrhizobium elkanii]MCW2201558.1 hypothetical protein [Bradyrhizobium elkanii]